MTNHNHPFPTRLTIDCPACAPAINARNQAIDHLSEALDILAGLQDPDTAKTIRLSLSPLHLSDIHTVDLCHGWEITPKVAEFLADAVDSMNAHLGSQPAPTVDAVPPVCREAIASGEYSAAAVAQNEPGLYADVTDLFMLVDPQSYLDDVFNAPEPDRSLAAYEQMVTGEWDEEGL